MKKKIVKKPMYEGDFSFGIPDSFGTRLDLLNWALGSGFPLGRQVTIYGSPGVGKTSLSFELATTYLREKPGDVYYIEGEGKPPLESALTKFYGLIDGSRIHPKRFRSLEEMLYYLETKVEELEEGFLIVDSLASFGAEKKEGKDVRDVGRVGGEALKHTELAKGSFFKVLSTKPIGFILINQLRDTLNSIYEGKHPPGGKALHHSATVEIELSLPFKGILYDSNNNPVGQDIEIEIVKNHLNTPYKKVTIPFYYDYGFDNEESLVRLAIKKGMLPFSKGWVTYKEKNARKSEVSNHLRENKEEYLAFKDKLFSCLK